MSILLKDMVYSAAFVFFIVASVTMMSALWVLNYVYDPEHKAIRLVEIITYDRKGDDVREK